MYPDIIPPLGLRISRSVSFLIQVFWNINGKIAEKSHISQTKRYWAVRFRENNCNPWVYSDIPNIRLRISSFINFVFYLSLFKQIKRNHKNAIPREPKRLEHSHLDTRLATPGFNLTAPHYKVENFKFGYLIFYEKKIEKNVKSQKPKGFIQSLLKGRFATPIDNWQDPALGLRIWSSLSFSISNFLVKKNEKKKKKHKNAISRKPKCFEQSYLDSRYATPECTPVAPHYKVEKILSS